jgi:hypothetical protein
MEIHDPGPHQTFLNLAGTNAVSELNTSGCFAFLDVSNKQIKADAVHLFHGKDFTGTGTIGCAFVLSATQGLQHRRQRDKLLVGLYPEQLVAHETRHGAQHMSGST